MGAREDVVEEASCPSTREHNHIVGGTGLAYVLLWPGSNRLPWEPKWEQWGWGAFLAL